MCGLFGVQFKTNQVAIEQRAILAAVLATHMDRRGGDSWGVFTPATNKLKRGLGWISAGLKAADLAKRDCYLAHTRRATTGHITKANAHPFRFGRLVGAHNGMVSNHPTLNRVYGRTCPVDSQHIFLHIEEGHSLAEIEGYGAVSFCLADLPDRVYLGTFNDGELAVFGGDWGLVWASTPTAVRHALHLAGLKGWEFEVEDHQLYYAQGGRLLMAPGEQLDVSPYRTTFAKGIDYRKLTSSADSSPVDWDLWDHGEIEQEKADHHRTGLDWLDR